MTIEVYSDLYRNCIWWYETLDCIRTTKSDIFSPNKKLYITELVLLFVCGVILSHARTHTRTAKHTRVRNARTYTHRHTPTHTHTHTHTPHTPYTFTPKKCRSRLPAKRRTHVDPMIRNDKLYANSLAPMIRWQHSVLLQWDPVAITMTRQSNSISC